MAAMAGTGNYVFQTALTDHFVFFISVSVKVAIIFRTYQPSCLQYNVREDTDHKTDI